jgi:tRNA(Ile)-lysidine synthase
VKLPGRVALAITLHQVFTRGERVVVAVSGGPDSLALLSILREILPAFPLHLTVAHFDHRWRPDSAADRDFVADISARWGLDFRSDANLPEAAHTENAAREARYGFLHRIAADTNSTAIALGHTRDDQVETLLLHLLRGAGSHGLGAMRWRQGTLARPLLETSKADVEAYLRRLHLTPLRDPSNENLRFTRNRLRQQLLPAIDAFDPSARELLARTADILAEEDRYLEEQSATISDSVIADKEQFAQLPAALQRRLIRRLIPNAGFPQVEETRLRGDGGVVQLSSPVPTHRQLRTSVCACDRSSFRAGDAIGHLDADLVRMPLRITRRHAGDRMRPLGLANAKRLQDILVDARVPRHLRDTLPIVCDQEEIVWIPAVTVSETKKVTGRTLRQLHLEIVPA